jgi:transcriptional regulator of nitric oxide reductase
MLAPALRPIRLAGFGKIRPADLVDGADRFGARARRRWRRSSATACRFAYLNSDVVDSTGYSGNDPISSPVPPTSSSAPSSWAS